MERVPGVTQLAETRPRVIPEARSLGPVMPGLRFVRLPTVALAEVGDPAYCAWPRPAA